MYSSKNLSRSRSYSASRFSSCQDGCHKSPGPGQVLGVTCIAATAERHRRPGLRSTCRKTWRRRSERRGNMRDRPLTDHQIFYSWQPRDWGEPAISNLYMRSQTQTFAQLLIIPAWSTSQSTNEGTESGQKFPFRRFKTVKKPPAQGGKLAGQRRETFNF